MLCLLIDLIWFSVNSAFNLMLCSGILYFEFKIQKIQQVFCIKYFKYSLKEVF